jgi:nucleotidyltransferase/DNA polymerase involved in DNA repair
MIACVFTPRFSLRIACPDRLHEPIALAAMPGTRPAVGEVSRAAEATGIHAGMSLAEAIARCPSLRLIPADPALVAEHWDALLVRLEGIGAAVESERAGEVFFAVDGLRGIHGGDAAGVLAAAQGAAQMPVRIAAAPNRFAAFVAAAREPGLARGAGGAAIVSPSALPRFLAPISVASLTDRLGTSGPEATTLVRALKRLGLGTLGKLAALSADKVADRFGSLGLRALRLAQGEDEPLRPRAPREELVEKIELPEGTAGPQLDRAIELLVTRFLAAPVRRGRTLLALRLSALLDGGGSWSIEQGLSRPTTSAQTIGLLLTLRLGRLPAPATTLQLQALALGPPAVDQLELALDGQEPRKGRLRAAVRELRAAAGPEALLKIVEVDPRSRVPERRVLLTPHPDL